MRSELLADEDFVSYFGVPLIGKGEVKGVLELFHRSELNPDQEWLSFLETLGGQTTLAIENAILFQDLQRSNFDLAMAYDATIEGWSHALDLRDKDTEGHTLRVTEMALKLAPPWVLGRSNSFTCDEADCCMTSAKWQFQTISCLSPNRLQTKSGRSCASILSWPIIGSSQYPS